MVPQGLTMPLPKNAAIFSDKVRHSGHYGRRAEAQDVMTRISVSINYYITVPQEHGDSTWGAPGSPEKASGQGHGSVVKGHDSVESEPVVKPHQVEFRGLQPTNLSAMSCLSGSLAALGTAFSFSKISSAAETTTRVDGRVVRIAQSIEAWTCVLEEV
ncbi:unnamed protein product [Clonostachys rosea]|uniref:Uncharacterized protein n=1 Tax=Bionectria ochroleuca TaxID=29856 RepID=A0ABY6U4S3_BIOOC|nr:unnamed protein product [Clonostachys rosea]